MYAFFVKNGTRQRGSSAWQGGADVEIIERMNNESSREWAKRVLLENIIHLKLMPGTPLSDKDIAASLSISRTPVREALVLLEDMGFINLYPQKGTFVSLFDINHIEESRYIRKCLEADTLQQACKAFSDDAMIALKANAELQKNSLERVDRRRFLDLDQIFHHTLCEGCERGGLWEVTNKHALHFFRVRRLKVDKGFVGQDVFYQHHLQLIDAIKKHDSEHALEILNDHLSWDVRPLRSAYPELFAKESRSKKNYFFTSDIAVMNGAVS